MRIAVFSTPRTCSTFMCDVVANNFNVINHNEGVYSTFGSNKEGKIEWLKLNDDYVVKLFAKYFFDNLYIIQETFDWNMFDHVFITERTDLPEQMASIYNIWHDGNSGDYIDFTTDDTIDLYNRHKNYMQTFYDIKKHLLENHKSVHVVEYEKLQTDPIPYLNDITGITFTTSTDALTKTNINYKEKYTNYDQLNTIINNWNLIKT